MFRSYKSKIILWYTVLVTIIISVIFVTMYSILGYQLRNEIDKDIFDRIPRIEKMLRDFRSPPEPSDKFLDYMVRGRYTEFYDLREITDVADDKYLLMVFCGDELMYMSSKYKPNSRSEYAGIKQTFQTLRFEEEKTETVSLYGISFSVSLIDKKGYSLYLGYDLSTIMAVEKRILQIFFFIAPFGILLSILCGFYITLRMLRVIKRITQTTNQITAKNLSERIKVSDGQDEISQLGNTLNLMIDRLERSFIMVQQFSHDAAHEIRTPLTIIQGEIEEILNNPPSTIESRQLEKILEEIQYLTSIADKLLLIHTLDTHEIEYHFELVNLSQITSEVASDAVILSSVKEINVKTSIEPNIEIQGNDELLTRLLWNLIDNAVKYSKPMGSIDIILRSTSSGIEFIIKDSGIGIPSKDIGRIFDRFYRVDKSRSRKLGGSGLGLAICKWIVELHKGSIEVSSKENVGSEFIVRFL